MTKMSRLFLLLLAFPASILALTYQNLWRVPDGDKGDLSQTFQSGQTLPLSWQAMNDSTNDLWITTFNYNEVQYSGLVTKDIDISVDGSYTWTINIPDSQLSKSAKYVLRFKPAASPRTLYSVDTVEISSPGFLVLAAAAMSSTIRSTTRTASATTIPTTSLTSNVSTSSTVTPSFTGVTTAAATSTAQSVAKTTLSTGAKAGIGIGAVAVALALASLFAWFCFFRLHRSSRPGEADGPNEHIAPQQQHQQYPWQASGQEKQLQEVWSEMPSMHSRPAELQGHDIEMRGVAELPGEERR